MELLVDGYAATVEPCEGGGRRGQVDLPSGHGCEAYRFTAEQLQAELRTSLSILLQDLNRSRD